MNSIKSKSKYLSGRMIQTAICSVVLGLCAASCGQRGPLYLPSESPAAGVPSDAATQEPETASKNDDFGVDEAESVPPEDGEEDEATS